MYAGKRHEHACADFLQKNKFSIISDIIRTHGISLPEPSTIEQQIVFYVDKRMNIDQKVSLEQRFDDWEERYGKTDRNSSDIWFNEAKKIELLLEINF